MHERWAFDTYGALSGSIDESLLEIKYHALRHLHRNTVRTEMHSAKGESRLLCHGKGMVTREGVAWKEIPSQDCKLLRFRLSGNIAENGQTAPAIHMLTTHRYCYAEHSSNIGPHSMISTAKQ